MVLTKIIEFNFILLRLGWITSNTSMAFKQSEIFINDDTSSHSLILFLGHLNSLLIYKYYNIVCFHDFDLH